MWDVRYCMVPEQIKDTCLLWYQWHRAWLYRIPPNKQMPRSMPLPMDLAGPQQVARAAIRAPAPHDPARRVPKPWDIFDDDDGVGAAPSERPSASSAADNRDISSDESTSSLEDSTEDDEDHES